MSELPQPGDQPAGDHPPGSAAPSAGGGAARLRVGMFPPLNLLELGQDAARDFLAAAGDAGIDHVCCGDHVSFAGVGFDGLLQAQALTLLHPRLPVYVGVFLLPLRHPVLVARQLADIERMAPGRLVLGVGIGGEDRHEVEICGVDPASRGRRMDECLALVRELQTGRAVTSSGEFFELDRAVIMPPAPVPLVVGGRSDAAIRRAGRLGDGWLGIWCSPRRFAAAAGLAAQAADDAGRAGPPSRHAMQVWCGLDGAGPRRAGCWPTRCRRSTGCRSSASSGTARTAARRTSPSSSRRMSRRAAVSST